MQVICFASPRNTGPLPQAELNHHNQEIMLSFIAVSYLICPWPPSIFKVLQDYVLNDTETLLPKKCLGSCVWYLNASKQRELIAWSTLIALLSSSLLTASLQVFAPRADWLQHFKVTIIGEVVILSYRGTLTVDIEFSCRFLGRICRRYINIFAKTFSGSQTLTSFSKAGQHLEQLNKKLFPYSHCQKHVPI